MDKRTVNNLEVTAKRWEKGNKRRVYFAVERNGGQACWDAVEKEFIKCHGRVGARFEQAIKAVFGLG